MDKWSERMPGPMKLEYQGNEMVALAAKSYYVTKDKEQTGSKSGCKGIQKSNKLTIDIFKKALRGEQTDAVTNQGFRFKTGKDSNEFGLQHYIQNKEGVSNTYNKRHVMENGVNTHPRRWEEDSN